LVRRKLEAIRKAEDIIDKDKRNIEEKLALIREKIHSLKKELENINSEREKWVAEIGGKSFERYELMEVMDYIRALDEKVNEVSARIEELEKEELLWQEKLKEKLKEKISLESIKNKLKEELKREEIIEETRKLDEHTALKNWFQKLSILLIILLPSFAFSANLKDIEKKVFKTPPEILKVLKKRKSELEKEKAKLEIEKKYLLTLKKDTSFLLDVLREKIKKTENSFYSSTTNTAGAKPEFSDEELNKLYKIVSRLPEDEGGQILSNVAPQTVAFLLLHVNSMKAAGLLANMETSKAAKVLEILYSLAPEKAKRIFNSLGVEQ
jgi:flagellar motility protein MotE (MotC chaperone)